MLARWSLSNLINIIRMINAQILKTCPLTTHTHTTSIIIFSIVFFSLCLTYGWCTCLFYVESSMQKSSFFNITLVYRTQWFSYSWTCYNITQWTLVSQHAWLSVHLETILHTLRHVFNPIKEINQIIATLIKSMLVSNYNMLIHFPWQTPFARLK